MNGTEGREAHVLSDLDWKDHLETRDPFTRHLVSLFEYGHLPEGPVRQTSVNCAGFMIDMVLNLEDGPELRAGLRKLVEAKDCFVRQAVHDGRS